VSIAAYRGYVGHFRIENHSFEAYFTALNLSVTGILWHTSTMQKRVKQRKRQMSINQPVDQLMRESRQENGDSIGPPTKAQISLLMAELGRKGGRIGGKRRLQTMTAKERSAVAKKAAQARWKRSSN
jgi:hypothetical protein